MVWAALAGSAAFTSAALAGPVPDYDFEWASVGAVGNRAPIESEVPGYWPYMHYGSVNHRYRITKTEVTYGQWLEFVNAYAPFNQGPPRAFEMTGFYLSYNAGTGQYSMTNGADRAPMETSWRMAARYCNWLQNGKVAEQWAFETGAYDTSTFGRNPDGTFTDQLTHNADAQFWIPTYDEWVKALYYDPNKYGQGQEGYWAYPHANDSEPISGLPQDGGETNAGILWSEELMFMDVGSYPDVQSPWGLLDGSGGQREWSETAFDAYSRIMDGSRFGMGNAFPYYDLLDFWGFVDPDAHFGFRVASQVPSPASVLLLTCPFNLCRRRVR